MKYTMRYSDQARKDLRAVWDDVYHVSGERDTADRYTSDLLACIRAKKPFPRSGHPLCFGDMFTGYYMIVFKAYHIFYRIEENRMEISRILPGKMDFMRVLFGVSDVRKDESDSMSKSFYHKSLAERIEESGVSMTSIGEYDWGEPQDSN